MSETDTFEAMADDLLDLYGLTATYIPAVGSPVTCRVDLATGVSLQPGSLDAQVWGTESTLEYLLSEVGVEASEGDVFSVDDVDYTVSHVVANDGILVKVAVQ